MQRRDVTCRLVEQIEDAKENVTVLDSGKCDESSKPLQRQECYNDACKGVWRVGEWSEVSSMVLLLNQNVISHSFGAIIFFYEKKMFYFTVHSVM